MPIATDSLGILQELAESLAGRVRNKRVDLMGGAKLTHQLRAVYRKHKIELLANADLILVDVEAPYGPFELIVVNPRYTRFGKPARSIENAGVRRTIFTIDGMLSPAQSVLYESGSLMRLLDVINARDGEEINLSQRLVRVYLQRPSKDRVMRVVHAVIDLMPHSEAASDEFATFPEVLLSLVPLIAKWSIDDDEERSRKLSRCSNLTRRKLVDAVVPLLPAIDQFLVSFGVNPPEEACALGSLAQAALEAQSLLSIHRQREAE